MHSQVDRQHCSRLVMHNGSFIIKRSLTENKNMESSKQGINPNTYPKYTTNLSVSTLSTQKELWAGEGEDASVPFAKISL